MGISSRATALPWPRPGSVGRLLCAWMLLVAGILAGGFAAPAAQAGIILDGESDASYRDLADDYPSVGFLNFQISGAHYVCSGTLVAHRWVLTAAHCADGATNMSVRFGSDYYSVDETVVHPDWSSSVSEGNDIALVQLSTAVTGIVPSALYTGSDDALRLWLNGKLIHQVLKLRPVDYDSEFCKAEIKAGENTLVAEVSNAAVGWGFCIRLEDDKGNELEVTRVGKIVEVSRQ